MAPPARSITIAWETNDDWHWRVNYAGGESDLVDGPSQITIMLSDCPGLQVGQECWPLIEPGIEKNHECGDNVAYDPNGEDAWYDVSTGGGGMDCSLRT